MNLQTRIAPAILRVYRRFTVLSTATPTVYRTTAATPLVNATTGSVGTRPVAIIRNEGSREQINAAGAGVYAAKWLVAAALDTDLRAEDIVSDGARAFVLLSAPETDQGFMLAPAAVAVVPAPAAVVGGGFRSALPWLGLGA